MAKEFFIYSQSFAAPFISDSGTDFMVADTPTAALEQFAAEYEHPAGLYSAGVWASADDYHKRKPPLARWLSNHAATIEKKTEGLEAYSIKSDGPGVVEIDGKAIRIQRPKAGAVRA